MVLIIVFNSKGFLEFFCDFCIKSCNCLCNCLRQSLSSAGSTDLDLKIYQTIFVRFIDLPLSTV